MDSLIRAIFEQCLTGFQWDRNGEHKALCPFHNDNKTKSFSFNDEGIWNCFSGVCGKNGNIEQFALAMGIDYKGRLPKRYTKRNPRPVIKVDKVLLKIKAEEYNKAFKNKIQGNAIESSERKYQFLIAMLIGKDENDRGTFPYFDDNGDVIAIKHHKGKAGGPPYWNKGGDNKCKWYNGWNLRSYKPSEALIIAEGEPDVIKLCKLGFQAIFSSAGTNSVPPLIPRLKEWL